MATAAERTRHIRLGTGVVSLPYHHPLMVANRMVLLDHLTRGRVMLGVGPGALVTDAHMLGINPARQREMMDESLTIIMRLLTETEPITYRSDWFELNDALLHLRPYTRPHFPIAVASVQSPAGRGTGRQVRGRHPVPERLCGRAGRGDAARAMEDRRGKRGSARQQLWTAGAGGW